MQRYGNTRYATAAQAGSMFRVVPVARFAVAPGTTMEGLSALVRVNTGVCTRRLMAGAQLDVYAFYVPNRLVLGVDTWTDVLLGDASVPTATVADPWVFEPTPAAGSPFSILGRASARYCYNQYFGQEGLSWFPNILDAAATNANVAKARTLEQALVKMQINAVMTDTTLNIPVTGSNAVLSLNEFRAAMADSRSKRKQQATGDKYFDILQQFGVSASWSIQMAPEFLGSARQVLKPNGGRSSNGAAADSFGDPYSYFEGEVSLRSGRRFFAEHGLIWVFAVFRPYAVRRGTTSRSLQVIPPDARMAARDDFFWPKPDMTGEVLGIGRDLYEGGAANYLYTQGGWQYLSGVNSQGAVSDPNAVPFLTVLGDTAVNSLYPTVQDTFRGNGGSDLTYWCAAQLKEATPVPKLKLA